MSPSAKFAGPEPDPLRRASRLPSGAVGGTGVSVLRLDAMLDPGVPYSVLAVDSLDLAWERRAVARGDRLVDFRRVWPATPLSPDSRQGDAWVLDRLAADRPKRLSGGGHWLPRRVLLRPLRGRGTGRPGRSWPSIRQPPTRPVVEASPSRPSLHSLGSEGADYLDHHVAGARGRGRRTRRATGEGGLRTVVVTTDRIYDEYSGGNLDPKAIRDFLWRRPPDLERIPSFVVLAGPAATTGATLGVGDKHVPPMMVATPFGLAGVRRRPGRCRGR